MLGHDSEMREWIPENHASTLAAAMLKTSFDVMSRLKRKPPKIPTFQ